MSNIAPLGGGERVPPPSAFLPESTVIRPGYRARMTEIRHSAGRAVGRTADKGLERLLHVQRPVVLAHLRAIRKRRPDASPTEILRALERNYLAAVITGGAATGAVSVIPGIGTIAGLAISGAEAVGFLEASALFVQSAAEVHGLAIDDPERARALVMTLVLCNAGKQALLKVVNQAQAGTADKSTKVGELVGKALPLPLVDLVMPKLTQVFVQRFAVSQGTSALGRVLPFGIGAVVGGGANYGFGRSVVNSVRDAFDAPPETLPVWLEPIPKGRRTPQRKRRGLRS